jgi:hypothetical protein
MGISEFHQRFAFKVEPKPGGGYVSKSDNPALVVEGATEEEVEQKALQKIGELGGPEIAAVIRDLQKPGAVRVAGEKKFSVSINKKSSFSFGKKRLADADSASSTAELAGSVSDPFSRSSEGGLSATVKFLIIVAALALVFWLIYRR